MKTSEMKIKLVTPKGQDVWEARSRRDMLIIKGYPKRNVSVMG